MEENNANERECGGKEKRMRSVCWRVDEEVEKKEEDKGKVTVGEEIRVR